MEKENKNKTREEKRTGRRPLRERLGREWLFFDGGMGSLMQERGLKGGELPEIWNLSRPEDVIDLHVAYLEAGCDICNTNTFGANALKFPGSAHGDLRRIVEAAVHLAGEARRRAGREDAYIALDIGPTGRLLAPLGDLAFEEAVEIFGEVVRIGAAAGADLVLIETMSDSYESKAAVLAARENCDLPVLITNVYDKDGRLLTGGNVDSTVALLEGLGVDGLGVNCGLGPEQMVPIVERLARVASVPILVNPNAGLPRVEGGRTVYDIGPDDFAAWMKKIAAMGVQAVGGCCGTTPAHIRRTVEAVRGGAGAEGVPFAPNTPKRRTVVSSYAQAVEIGRRPVIVGERINPTGKKKFKEALRARDIDYILSEGLRQEEDGADILDVNVGLPEIDEPQMMAEVVTGLQEILSLPLQIDTADPVALERGMRLYNGKPMINSVNGKRESMEAVFPLVKKYGGVVVGLALDEDGIPATAEGRVAIAKKIYETAGRYGIPQEDVVIDGLAMAISSDNQGALATLETLRRVRDEFHGHTILGVSNISFGLPQRPIINAHFLTMALQMGLSCAIMNPGSGEMMAAYRAFLALSGQDPQCMGYVEAFAGAAPPQTPAPRRAGTSQASPAETAEKDSPASAAMEAGHPLPGLPGKADPPRPEAEKGAMPGQALALAESVRRGRRGPAAEAARGLLEAGMPALGIIDGTLIPALDDVGRGFEAGTIFLPQLLMSAEAAGAAFEVIKASLQGEKQESKGRVILATVKGDIHDIGKNIVKVMLENYGFDILDLGKDVAPEAIVQAALREDIRLVGLSALMTTTVASMEETIRQLRAAKPDTRVVVGGAVMTRQYAETIGADCYAPDAMATVHYAEEVFSVGKM